MSIEQTASGPVLRCDGAACGETFGGIYDRGDTRALKADARDHGWRSFKTGSSWRDSCPDCVRAWARTRGGRTLL